MPDPSNVSVVVPVYNAEKTLEACIRSVLAQEYPAQRELLFVNNASTDGSLAILSKFKDQILILSEPKRGPAAARNRGIAAARFPVIAFLDSDCVAGSGWLEQVVAPLADPTVGLTGGAVRALAPRNALELFGETIHDNQASVHSYRPPYVGTANCASRKEALEKLHGFDETFLRGEDVELSNRVLQAGFRLAYAADAVVYHRNESTWWGLMCVGFAHGVAAIAVIERHRAFYAGFGFKPRRWKVYRRLWRPFRAWVRGGDPAAACSLVFEAGTRAGRLVGSIRRGDLHF
jgi:mycofactocin glycosyltransferase